MSDELQPGSPAPDFTLADQNGNKVRLSDYRGKYPVVLFFYPKDDSPGCTKEACKFRDEFENFRNANLPQTWKEIVYIFCGFHGKSYIWKYAAPPKIERRGRNT